MKQLEKVLNKTSWARASNTINTNSESVFSAVTMLENAAFKQKGYFLTSEELEQLHPSAEEGSQAFVYNSSNPSTAPYDIYQMIGGTWADTGLNGGNVNVNLDSKQDTLVGYSESVSGGKATQVAIQGDAIALSGKVSLGNVDDMESAILMSSSQAGEAIAKANTLEQSISALKLPVKPIHLNSQGKLELSVGKGLYVEEGKLCATGASSSGGGGGKTYSEGDGIKIINDAINVSYDHETIVLNDCGGLAVNIGEGFIMKDGKLSVQASVNAGNGLVKKGDKLQVSVGTGLLVEDEVYINMGKGLTSDNENKVNINLDEQTLTTDSSGKVIVKKEGLIGNGIKQEYGKFAVNYGTGLALSNKAIVVNYGTGLSIQDGKLVSTAQGGKTYTSGEAIDISGNEINVKYDGVTISTKDTADNSLHVMLGSGLTQGTSGIDVALGKGLKFGSGGNLIEVDGANLSVAQAAVACSASYADYAAKATSDANGYNIAKTYAKTCELVITSVDGEVFSKDSKKLGMYLGYGLTKASQQGVYVKTKTNGGLAVDSCGVQLKYGAGLDINSCGKLYVKDGGKTYSEGNGIIITDDVINVNYDADTMCLNSCGGLAVNAGVALGTSDGKLNVQYGTGLGKSTDNKLQVLLGTGLAVEGNYIRVEEAVYDSIEKANAGVSRAHEVVTKLQTALGGKQNTLTLATGLEWGKTDMIQVKMNAPLNYDEGGRLKLNYDSTLTVSNNKLGVDLYDVMDSGGGLFIKNTGLAVNVGRGLKIESCQVVVSYGTGMSESNNKIYVDTSKIAGVGIDLDSDYKMLTIGTKAAKELAGTGLVADGAKMKVKYGSGLTTNTCGGLIVDAGKLTVGKADEANSTLRFKVIVNASTTIDCNTYKEGIMYNYNAVNLWKNAPSGMSYGQVLNLRNTFAAPDLLGQLAWDVNHGSTTDTTRNLWWRASDDGTLTEAKWHQIAFMDAVPLVTTLFQRGDYQYFVVLLCKYGTNLTNTSHRLSGKIYSEGHGAGRYVAADVDIFVSDWSSGMDKNLRFDTYGINEMDLVTCNYGGVKYLAIRNYGIQAKNLYFAGTSTNMLLTPIHYYTVNTGTVHNTEINGSIAKVTVSQPLSNGNKYALVTDTVARATADANGNNIAATYAKDFTPTNGLAINEYRTLYLPNLTASLANGAVDGSKNGAQRVLNLSCGAIQIKLSTGLAIDDNGYLYIQDKYVTK